MTKVTPNTQGILDRHQQILAAVSKEAQRLEARPDCENELSNPKFRKHYRMRVKRNSAAPGIFNSLWVVPITILVFVVIIFLTNSCLGL